jgi:GAF domain-containing protein
MSATAVSSFRNQQVVWKESFAKVESDPIAPLLDLGLRQAHAQGAYVYRFEGAGGDATLIAFAGHPPQNLRLTLTSGVWLLHLNRKTPVVLRSQAASDWRFADLPEFQTARFDGVISVPLLDSGETVGLANFCHIGEEPISDSALSFLMNLSLPLGALLIASTLRDQLRKATQDLVARKLLERAKGLLQAHFQWTEEDAYLRIRRLSRQRRAPMRDIAQLVIDSSAESLAEVWKPEAWKKNG